MRSQATSVEGYLASLTPDRRAALAALRALVRKCCDPKLEEGIQYGMIGYYVPHRIYPEGYHTDPEQPLPFAGIASQKQHMALYLMHLAIDPEEAAWFRAAWSRSGKKLDAGKSCIRFKKLDDLALDVVREALERVSVTAYVTAYQRQLAPAAKRARSAETR
ncbi:MAG TPA: DUF1801 domain-containing protein [Polyangiaceae bacterium]|nr:DUF1801 domain-containing protein [Polyangiaceae bacterium]